MNKQKNTKHKNNQKYFRIKSARSRFDQFQIHFVLEQAEAKNQMAVVPGTKMHCQLFD